MQLQREIMSSNIVVNITSLGPTPSYLALKIEADSLMEAALALKTTQ